MSAFESLHTNLNRRAFLSRNGVALGTAALATLLHRDLPAAEKQPGSTALGGLPDLPHFAAKAKRVIFLCMAGGPTHLETFD